MERCSAWNSMEINVNVALQQRNRADVARVLPDVPAGCGNLLSCVNASLGWGLRGPT